MNNSSLHRDAPDCPDENPDQVGHAHGGRDDDEVGERALLNVHAGKKREYEGNE